MTNEEAIQTIKSECYISDLLNLDRTRMVNSALDKAVEALRKTDKMETVKQAIVQGDCIMLTREAYSDLCLRASKCEEVEE